MDMTMELLQETLQMGCEHFGFTLSEFQREQFETYARLLVEWNEKMNLTAITKPQEIAMKHFVDSLLLTKAIEVERGASLIDVGTGAGFPGIPVKILREDLQLTLLDSLKKRIGFLTEVTGKLGLGAICIHARAEEQGKKPQEREQYDIACARAVAHLRELAEYCLPFVRVGGVFAALKGYEIEQELQEAKKAISLMGGQVENIEKYELPDTSRRSIVIIRKKAATPPKYPRPSAKIAKAPLI